jgi:MFS family permease
MPAKGSANPISPTDEAGITPNMNRRNGIIFVGAFICVFLAAPIIYVGAVQAALCQRLGASTSVANLPAAANLLGQLAPLFLSSWIRHRHERLAVVFSNSVTAASCFLIAIFLSASFSNSISIAAIVAQGLLQGVTSATSLVFMYQCLGRGTTVDGRARTLKATFSIGPLAAVAGSLATQGVLNHGISGLHYPYDFAFVYLCGALCATAVAIFASRYDLPPMAEESRPPMLAYLKGAVVEYLKSRTFVRLWIAYAFWYSTLAVIPNLSLFSRVAMHRSPQEVAGLTIAVRFGGKSVIGYFLGGLMLRYGIRAPVVATVALLGIATAWGWLVPGYGYLFAFALMGGGELGGAYFPNYVVTASPLAAGVRNLSILTLATPAASLGAVLHGALADHWGFPASFLFGTTTAALALLLVVKLPSRPTIQGREGETQ